MAPRSYEYSLDQCDVPKVRLKSLQEYREFRSKCLNYLNGEADTSVMNQIHTLAWQTAVFRTLNEARRLEPTRTVNGAFWELTTAGYASLMAVGIRKLVDKDKRSDSVWNVIREIERRPELLTREKFICYDGIPYGYDAVEQKYIESLDPNRGVSVRWLPTRGPEAWDTSQIMHKVFDKLAFTPSKEKRNRTETIQPELLKTLKDHLSHPAIIKVCTMTDRIVAHAERVKEDATPIDVPTYNDVDQALKQIVRVASFLSSYFFYESSFGSIVPIPQFDQLEGLDSPWVTKKNLPHLHEFWMELSNSMGEWTSDASEEFLSNVGVNDFS